RFHQLLLQSVNMALAINFARRDTLVLAYRCSHGHGLPRVGAGCHYPRSAESHMAYADDPPGKEKIIDTATVQTTVRNLEHALAVPLVAGFPFAKHPVGRVQVDRPTPVGHRIRMV